MPKASKPGYYAVRVGRLPGIYHTWADCDAQVKGFTNAVYKKLSTETEAIEFMAARPSTASTSVSAIRPSVVARGCLTVEEDEQDCDVVYCDGACKGNGQPGSVAGIGVWWGHGDPRNISERCPGDQTNNRAELVAIVRILETTPRLQRRLLIKTDSNYSIQCVTSWINNWMRNGFVAADGKPIKNRALIRYLAALLRARRKTSQSVEFKHVRGHVGIEGNEAADQLANLGATKPVIPERDWKKLEKQALQGFKPSKLVDVVDDDLKAYADDLLNDDELAELADTSIGNVVLPVEGPSRELPKDRKHAARNHTSVSPPPHEVSLPRVDAASRAAIRSSDAINAMRNRRVPSRGFVTRPVLSAITISKEELEAFASCLLPDDELLALGKDGVFDSDF